MTKHNHRYVRLCCWAGILTLSFLLGGQAVWAKVYSVQIGVFQRYQNAQRQYRLLKKSIPSPLSDQLRIEKTGKSYVLKVGKTDNLEQALNLLSALKPFSPDAFVWQDDSIEGAVLKKEDKPIPPSDSPTRKEKTPSAFDRNENESVGKILPILPIDQSEVTATILQISSIPSEQLGLPPGKNMVRLILRVEEPKAINGTSDLIKERIGKSLTVFSENISPFFQPGKKITAVIEYRGNRSSRFYWIKKPQAFKP